MSDEGNPPAGDVTPPATPPAADQTPPATPPTGGMDAEAVNALVAKTKNTAAANARREQATAAGFESPEAMDAYLTAAREREKADMTEVDRLKAEATEAANAAAVSQAAADEATREAREATARANLQLALVAAGVNPDRIGPAMTLGLGAILQATADAPVTEEAAVAQVQAASPEWFGTPPPPPKPTTPPPPGQPPAPKPNDSDDDSPKARAQRKRDARKAKRVTPFTPK